MLQYAFKEWAAVCKALAAGRQAIIIRKGGIEEEAGEFRVEHQRFWLMPTYTHQQQTGIQPGETRFLTESEADRPPEGMIKLNHFAEVTGIYHVKDSWLPHMLAHLHIWSEETVSGRFAYRTPGLYVLSVRVYRAPVVHEIVDLPSYHGCKSWIQLEEGLPTDNAKPVLSDREMNDVAESLDLILNPSAFA